MKGSDVAAALESLKGTPEKIAQQSRFFKTGKGDYGEGDKFLAAGTPNVRAAVKQFKTLPLDEVVFLLDSPFNEVRLCGLLIMKEHFKKADSLERERIIDIYLKRTDAINNWNLVDLSADMLGEWLLDKNRDVIYKLAESDNMWEQRIAVIATIVFIRNMQFGDTLALCKMLIGSKHDLMHKATGWMLREVGKRDPDVLRGYLAENYAKMPRTSLRYAIERFTKDERDEWLKKPH